MNRIPARAVTAALVGLLVSAQAVAQTAVSTPSPPAAAKAQNPNEVVCEKQKVLGSRLGTRRVCMTRAQWADLQLQDRQEIERVQVRRGMNGQ